MSQHTAASNSDTGTDTDPDHDPKIRIASLFCGAGGLDWSAIEAIKDAALDMDAPTEKVLNEKVDLVGVNHWSTAIESHEKNHPWGRQIEEDIKNVSAREAFGEPNPDVKLLMGGIECKHWSTARGGAACLGTGTIASMGSRQLGC